MTRDDLHRLVDTLPEGALENTKRVLEHFQVWPPQESPDVERIRREQLERMRRRMRPGIAGSGGGTSSYKAGAGGIIEDGTFSSNRMEDNSSVTEMVRIYRGHELTITHRLRLDDKGKTLIYVHEVAGPKGRSERQEISFDVS
jgi:hypothetical protein